MPTCGAPARAPGAIFREHGLRRNRCRYLTAAALRRCSLSARRARARRASSAPAGLADGESGREQRTRCWRRASCGPRSTCATPRTSPTRSGIRGSMPGDGTGRRHDVHALPPAVPELDHQALGGPDDRSRTPGSWRGPRQVDAPGRAQLSAHSRSRQARVPLRGVVSFQWRRGATVVAVGLASPRRPGARASRAPIRRDTAPPPARSADRDRRARAAQAPGPRTGADRS